MPKSYIDRVEEEFDEITEKINVRDYGVDWEDIKSFLEMMMEEAIASAELAGAKQPSSVKSAFQSAKKTGKWKRLTTLLGGTYKKLI